MIRTPTPDDVPDLARIQVQAWRETYPGLLPEAEIARRDLPYRLKRWARTVVTPRGRVAYAPGKGFAEMGPQTDPAFAAQGYTEELLSLYVLREFHGTGVGHALLSAVVGDAPFTALMVAANAPAGRFYRRTGGVHLDRREVTEGTLTFTEDAFGWTPPFAFLGSPR